MPTLRSGRYTIPEKWKSATNGRWVLGMDTEMNKPVFIKEFQGRRYRDNPQGLPNIARANERTEAYYQRMLRINAEVGKLARTGGDVVVTTDFFREGNQLYKVTEQIDIMPWDPQDVHNHLDVRQVDRLMLRLVNAISALHGANLLHCDLKPENVFIVKEEDAYVGMISDFDDSFFMDDVPLADDVVGTPEYMSPELAYYKQSDLDEPSDEMPLTTASDMFAIGLIYHMYLTGTMPSFDEDKYGQFFAVLFDEEGEYQLSDKLDAAHHALIQKLLFPMPAQRIRTCPDLAREIQNINRSRERKCVLTLKEGGKPVASRDIPIFTAYSIDTGEGQIILNDIVKTVHTDSRGIATLIGIPPTMPLFVECGDELKQIAWKGDGALFTCVVDLSLAPRYHLLVRCDGRPCPGIKVTLCRKNAGGMERLAPKQTGSDGRVEFEDLPEGEYSVIIGKTNSRIQWDEAHSCVVDMKTYTLRVRTGTKPTTNKLAQLSIVIGSKEFPIKEGITDEHGCLKLRFLANKKQWSVVCEGKKATFVWPECSVYEMILPEGTEARMLTTLKDSTTPVQGVTVVIAKHENGTYKIIHKHNTDINGIASFGHLEAGEYAVGVWDTPECFKPCGIKLKKFIPQILDGKKEHITWRVFFLREYNVGDPETILQDIKIPKCVSERWIRLVRYKDGSILLVAENGDTKKLSNERQLGLYGLGDYKSKE